jgi:hypothetical protein
LITHEEALLQMEAYFSNQLSREEVRAFHAHMNICEDCKVRLRTMRAAAPSPGFARMGLGTQEDKLQEILRKNRVIVYATLVIMICFFFFFRLKRG